MIRRPVLICLAIVGVLSAACEGDPAGPLWRFWDGVPVEPRGGDTVKVDSSALYYLDVTPDTVVLRIHDTAPVSAQLYDSSGVAVDSAHYLWNPVKGEWERAVDLVGALRAQSLSIRARLPGTWHWEIKGGLAPYPGINKMAWVDTMVLVFEPHYVRYDTIAPASYAACALDLDGRPFCWGTLWPTGWPLVPVPVPGDRTFTSITVARRSFCGLDPTGEVYCWGRGRLGFIDDEVRAAEGDEPIPVPGGHRFTFIDGMPTHMCGLKASGDAYCWGHDDYGQIGVEPEGTIYREPVSVPGGLSFRQLSVGVRHNCGVATDDRTYCWGSNQSHRLGVDTLELSLSADSIAYTHVPLPLIEDPGFVRVTAGTAHSCGLTIDGTVYCWGNNHHGQIGDGRTELIVRRPTPVAGDVIFRTIEAYSLHTCGLAETGDAWCWGYADVGVNGVERDDTEVCVSGGDAGLCNTTPVRVVGGFTFTSLGVGMGGCGIGEDGIARCWGRQDILGAGDHIESATPLEVVGSLPH